MKITNTSIETLAPAGAGAANGVQANQQGTAAKTSKTDSVSLSFASQLVSLAKAAAAAAPDRSAMLASLAAAVRTGQYSSDIASVSAAVVQGHIK
jgi:hypothetical protein